MTMSAGKYWGLRRLADTHGRFKMVAVDQRPPIKNPIAKVRGTDEAPYEDVAEFKALLIRELSAHSTALLLDPHYAIPKGLRFMDPGKGLIVTLEDSIFEETDGGRLSSEIDNWSVEKIKRLGGDAVKVLAWYRPDSSEAVRVAQQDFTKRIGDACAKYDIPYVFELLVYPLADDADQTRDYVEMGGKNPDHVLRSVEEFAKPEYGVDLFKLESPVGADAVPGVGNDGADDVQPIFDEMGKLAGRPWVMLSAGAGMTPFKHILTHAYAAGASGYLAGRAIWLDAFQAFPDWSAIADGLRNQAAPFMVDLNALTDAEATPWFDHECYSSPPDISPADAGFRAAYPGF
ncbi:MAG: tagatose 1,6-diphosphate aldolase [Pseudomonadota bacterium]